jgi:endonuclease/exonuclease/phosphatase family metal-dependent hydrolase
LSIYAFGLFGTGIPPEIIVILLIFSPIVLLFLRRGLSRLAMILIGELFLVSRAIEVLLDTRGQLLATGVGMACLMLILPGLYKNLSNAERKKSVYPLAVGLAFGLALAILMRALGGGLDIQVDGGLRWSGVVLCLFAGVLLPGAISPLSPDSHGATTSSSTGKIIGYCIGVMAVIVVLFFVFANPAIPARWVQADPLWSFMGVFLSLSLAVVLLTNHWALRLALRPTFMTVWNILFILAMVISILPKQLHFPTDQNLYPFYEPDVPFGAKLSMVVMIMLFPIVFLDFLLLSRTLAAARPSWRRLGAGFSLASLFFLVMILAHVFTTTYDYIPVIGGFFRDRYWLVHLVAGLGLLLPVLLVDRERYPLKSDLGVFQRSWLAPLAIVLIGIGAALSIWWASPKAMVDSGNPGAVKVFTYNVQQGYSGADQRNYAGQVALIQAMHPDIVGLQESDSLRIANGNADLVNYFANKLGMVYYYGPNPITGTFGVALLSKYPIQNPRTFYMFSKGEQTAAIVAEIKIHGKPYTVYVTHLGNGGPIFQQEAILKDVQGKNNVILMGDFNFRPYEEQYALTTLTLQDAWQRRWPMAVEDNGLQVEKRIDYIFTSPGMEVLDARYLTDPQSDHPALFAEIR